MIVSACVSSFVGWRKDEGEREREGEEKPREEEGESNISKQVPAPCSLSQCTCRAYMRSCFYYSKYSALCLLLYAKL